MIRLARPATRRGWRVEGGGRGGERLLPRLPAHDARRHRRRSDPALLHASEVAREHHRTFLSSVVRRFNLTKVLERLTLLSRTF
jgi:hypothetical protein